MISWFDSHLDQYDVEFLLCLSLSLSLSLSTLLFFSRDYRLPFVCNLEVEFFFVFFSFCVCVFGFIFGLMCSVLMHIYTYIIGMCCWKPQVTNDFDSRIMCLRCHLMWNFQFSYLILLEWKRKEKKRKQNGRTMIVIFRNISTYSRQSEQSTDEFRFVVDVVVAAFSLMSTPCTVNYIKFDYKFILAVLMGNSFFFIFFFIRVAWNELAR